MGKIIVNIEVVNHKTGRTKTMFRNIELRVIECSNRRMNEAFEKQHPKLFAKIPRWNERINDMTVTYMSYFSCKVVKY
jgi:hypothetical protein